MLERFTGGLARSAARAWPELLATKDDHGRLARGAAAGAFAAMLPVFGLHLAVALLGAVLLRGRAGAAAATCLLLGNPLTHAITVPFAFEIGRWLMPRPAGLAADMPRWLGAALPVAEETLVGGGLLGALAGAATFLAVRWMLAARRAHRDGE